MIGPAARCDACDEYPRRCVEIWIDGDEGALSAWRCEGCVRALLAEFDFDEPESD